MFYLVQLASMILVTLPAAVLTLLLGLIDPHGKYVYHIGRFWTWFILKLAGVSVNVQGLNRIDPGQHYIFIVNHQSNIDIPVLVQSLVGFQLRWIAKKELVRVPFFGWALWASKHIIVDRADRFAAAKSLKTAQKRMRAGISVVVFPEGTRSRDGFLLPFKKGGFLLAVRTGTPIVPVTINGTGRLLPAGAWRVKPGMVDVTVGNAIAVKNYDAGYVRRLTDQVRDTIARNLHQPQGSEAESLSNLRKVVVHPTPKPGAFKKTWIH